MNRSKTSETTCRVCNQTLKKLTDSHLKKHGLTPEEYKILYGDADGRYKQCAHVHKFTGHPCQSWVSPDSDDSCCILHSRDNGKDARLFEKIFRGLLDLYVKREEEMHFEGIVFLEDIDLIEMKFEKSTFFNDAWFGGRLRFWNSKFNADVNFRGCFFKSVSFRHAEFNVSADFTGATFEGRTTFIDTKFNTFPGYVRFINVRLLDPNQVVFRENDLSRVLFRDTNLSRVNLENVNWPKISWCKGNRQFVADEFYYSMESKYRITHKTFEKLNSLQVPSGIIEKLEPIKRKNFTKKELLENIKVRLTKEEVDTYSSLIVRVTKRKRLDYYTKIRLVYQRLKQNFEERKSFTEAGDFYYGEMECYRKINPFRRYFPFNMVNLYRISSGYGQRYIRAGVVLVLLLVLFSISHMFLGLEPSPHNRDYQRIDYDVTSLTGINTSILADFYISTVYCVEVLTREQEPDRLFQPLTTKGDAINTFFTILIYIQVVFFTLALRRHFKR